MLIGDQAAANTHPYIQSRQPEATIEHEASTCNIQKRLQEVKTSFSICSLAALSLRQQSPCW